MHEELFRKKSLDKVKSPESLDDYIRVSKPGVWLLLIGVIALLAGVCVWSLFGRIDSTVPATVRVENGVAVCMVAEEDIKSITEEMVVRFDGREAVIDAIGVREDGKFICSLKIDAAPTDGFYEGKVVTKSYKPVSFILN